MLLVGGLTLAECSDQGGDPKAQLGGDR
jgi:hypothetical protein